MSQYDSLDELLQEDRVERAGLISALEADIAQAMEPVEDKFPATRREDVIRMAQECGLVIALPSIGECSEIWHGASSLTLEFLCDKAAKSERDMLMQIFTDPENQPSQFGTVTIEYMNGQIAQQEPAAPVNAWIAVSERLPDAYADVLIKLADGSRRIGRLNAAGCWQCSSYQATKHQYMLSNVVAWLDVPSEAAAA